MEQRTEDWFQARLGKVTASRVADVIAKTKTGYSASRENYMAQLVVERLTNTQAESFTNAAMQWGTDQEPFARAAYELKMGVMVDETGLVDHPTIPMAGALTDGPVRDTTRMRSLGFKVFGVQTSPLDINSRYEVVEHNVPAVIDGVLINPGDLIVGDIDGVVVVPKDAIAEVVHRVEEKNSGENLFRKAVRDGMPPSEAFAKYGVL